MKAKFQRQLKDGRRHDALIAKPAGGSKTIPGAPGTAKTIAYMFETAANKAWQVRDLAKTLDRGDRRQTLGSVWGFVYSHIQYKPDKPGEEEVRDPARTWADRVSGVDCDCYSVFIGALLENLGIPYFFRVADYGNGDAHVYPVCGDTPIDCVLDRFGAEAPFFKKTDFKKEHMKLTGLNGIDDIDGIGAIKLFKKKPTVISLPGPPQIKIAPGPPRVFDNPVREVLDLPPPQPEYIAPPAKEKKVIGKIIQKVNKVNPATIVIRNAVLAVMKANVLRAAGKLRWGWATAAEAQAAGVSEEARRAAIDAAAKAGQKYETLGGNKDAFKAAILNGRGNKDKKVSALAGLSGLGGDEEVEFNDHSEMQAYLGMQGLGEPITATLLTAAGAFLESISSLLKSINLKKGADGTAEGEPEVDFGDGITPPAGKKPEDKKKKDFAGKLLDFGQKLTDKGQNIRINAKTGDDPKPELAKPMDPMLLILGGLLLAGGVYMATKDGKKDKSLSGPAKKAKPKARPKKKAPSAKTSFTKGKNGVLTARIK